MSYAKVTALRQLLSAAAILATLMIALPMSARAEEIALCIAQDGQISAISTGSQLASCPGKHKTLLTWNIAGPTGPTGAPGLVGPTGPNGPTGPAGPVGVAGNVGAVGPTGPKGIPGPPGSVGSEGFNGPTGPTGPTGETGVQGATGVGGATGAGGRGPSPTDNIPFPGGDQLAVLTGGTLGQTVGSDDGPSGTPVADVDLGGTERAIAMGPGNGSERAICNVLPPAGGEPADGLPCFDNQTNSSIVPPILPSTTPGMTATEGPGATPPSGDNAGIAVLLNNTTAVPMPQGCLEYFTVTTSNPPPPAVAGPGATWNYAFQVWRISFDGGTGITTATAGNNFCVIPSGSTSCSDTVDADDFAPGDLLLVRGVANGNAAGAGQNGSNESRVSWSASYQLQGFVLGAKVPPPGIHTSPCNPPPGPAIRGQG